MNIIRIENLDDPALAVYHQLSEPQLKHYFEPDGGLFIAESAKVITRALEAGLVPVSLLVEAKQTGHPSGTGSQAPGKDTELFTEGLSAENDRLLSRWADLFAEVPVYKAPSEVMNRITGYPMTRGALCALHRPALPSPEEVCRNCSRVAVLENVVNPTNVGAVFRSAAALGMEAVLLTPGCADPLQRRADRVSMGTVFQIPWTYIGRTEDDWIRSGLSELRAMGFKSAAMALREDTIPVSSPVLKKEEKLAVLLGTEGEGLREGTIRNSDYHVKIPMTHGVDSLNVAAASAVAFWELSRKM